jgi:AraC-like DNA-binding protein
VTIDWVQLATLVGAFQGFLLAAVLAAHRTNRTANRLLATLVAAFTIYLIQEAYYKAGLVRTYPHLFGLSYPLPWTFGPLVYLYAVAASDRTWRFQARTAVHFLPVIIVVIICLPIYMMSGPRKIATFEQLAVGDVPTLIAVLNPSKYISGLSYSAATVLYLRQHRRRIENTYSSTERVNLLWLIWLSAAGAAIWLMATVIDVAGVIPPSLQTRSDDVVPLAIAFLVYAIGYMGLRQPEIFRFDIGAPTSPVEAPVRLVETPAPSPEPTEAQPERYERSGLRDTEADALKGALLALMTKERPYRDPDLTLPDLAGRLNTTPHKLSEVLNSEMSQTFYDFINSYRVDDVRRRLAKSESKNLNLLTLAMDAGFASKSTFNQVFKKQTGQTPSTYRRAATG